MDICDGFSKAYSQAAVGGVGCCVLLSGCWVLLLAQKKRMKSINWFRDSVTVNAKVPRVTLTLIWLSTSNMDRSGMLPAAYYLWRIENTAVTAVKLAY